MTPDDLETKLDLMSADVDTDSALDWHVEQLALQPEEVFEALEGGVVLDHLPVIIAALVTHTQHEQYAIHRLVQLIETDLAKRIKQQMGRFAA